MNGPATIAIVISGLALGVSLTALAWQITAWFWTGPRIKLKSFSASVVGQPDHPEVLVLTVSNGGRMPATVEQWMFVVKGTLYGTAAWMSGPNPPHRLEPYSEIRWQQDYRETRTLLTANYPTGRHYWDMVSAVRVGDHWSYGGEVLRVWELDHFGPDPRITKPWCRWMPGATRVQTRHGTGWLRQPNLPR